MQVYADLAVLTARPSPDDSETVPHRLYGHVDAADAYSVGRYVEEAGREIAAARARGRMPVIVGGTGLYLSALVAGLSPMPPVPEVIRARWRAEARRLGGPGLHRVLAARDPVMAGRLDPADPQRIVRALEVIEATGRSLADWQGMKGRPVIAPEDAVRLVIMADRAWLVARARLRLDQMIRHGAVEEVGRLIGRGLPWSLPIFGALGVRPIAEHIGGRLSLDAAIEATARQTAAYIKRQQTWNRGQFAGWEAVAVTPEISGDALTGRVISNIMSIE